jgi:hypothetical protein
MTNGTKGGAQRAHSLRPRCFGVVDPETATHIYLSIYAGGRKGLMHVHDTMHVGRMDKDFTVSVNIKIRNAIAFNTVNGIRINTPLLFQ